MAVHKWRASLRPRCTRSGSRDTSGMLSKAVEMYGCLFQWGLLLGVVGGCSFPRAFERMVYEVTSFTRTF
jgi:hypothetical protein